METLRSSKLLLGVSRYACKSGLVSTYLRSPSPLWWNNALILSGKQPPFCVTRGPEYLIGKCRKAGVVRYFLHHLRVFTAPAGVPQVTMHCRVPVVLDVYCHSIPGDPTLSSNPGVKFTAPHVSQPLRWEYSMLVAQPVPLSLSKHAFRPLLVRTASSLC